MTTLSARGACYGFDVQSPWALTYLREPSGESEVLTVAHEREVVEAPADPPTVEWTPSATRPFHAKLYVGEDRHRLWVGGTWFAIDTALRRIEYAGVADPVRSEERLWGIPALLCFRERGDIPLHGAAVEVDGRAIVIAGPSGYGKTTIAAAFARAGHRVLNEDLCCVRLNAGIELVPGPAMLRVRPDVAVRLEMSFARCVMRGPERIHYALEGNLKGDGAPVPLSSIVLLDAPGDRVGLARVPVSEALRDVLALSFKLPNENDFARAFARIGDLVDAVPVWRLTHRRTIEDLESALDILAHA